jgi:hypothetical protein
MSHRLLRLLHSSSPDSPLPSNIEQPKKDPAQWRGPGSQSRLKSNDILVFGFWVLLAARYCTDLGYIEVNLVLKRRNTAFDIVAVIVEMR